MGMLQVRWLGIANALLLPTIPTCLGCIFGAHFPHRFSLGEKIAAVTIGCVLFGTFPTSSLIQTVRSLGRVPDLGLDDAFAVYIRDISYTLRRDNPDRELVILSGPTTTTYMMYHGSMKGIGTLYWENVPGLKAAAEIYSARTATEALELVKKHKLSHITIFASDAFAFEYTRLHRGLPFGAEASDAFIPSMIANLQSPRWLKPFHIQPPSTSGGMGGLARCPSESDGGRSSFWNRRVSRIEGGTSRVPCRSFRRPTRWIRKTDLRLSIVQSVVGQRRRARSKGDVYQRNSRAITNRDN